MSIYPPTGTLEIKNATLKIPVIDLQYTSNTAKIEANSNVVTEFSRSKKLIKYPRVAMTQNDESGTSGYVASASATNPTRDPYRAFDNVLYSSWHEPVYQVNPYPNFDGAYTGVYDTNGYQGEYLQIQLPEKIKLYNYSISNRAAAGLEGRQPKDAKIFASNDGTTWIDIHTHSDGGGTYDIVGETRSFQLDNITETHYKYYRLVINSIIQGGSSDTANISQWKLFGTPEYDPEAHGTDVVVKSVPNVPNTDWLEVYYDAKDYSGAPSSITDKSGNNITATANNITIDATYNSFEFTQSPKSNIIADNVTFVSGDESHSIVLWVRLKNGNANNLLFDYRVAGGTSTTGAATGLFILNSNKRLNFYHQGTDKVVDLDFEQNRWYHITGTYAGGGGFTGSKIYIDGVDVGGVISGTDSVLVLPATGTITIGDFLYNNTYGLGDGSIANFRLFNRALTSDEVWQLYAYQKEYFGHGDLSMTLKAGRLGIGTSEPRAALDVRGDIYAGRLGIGTSEPRAALDVRGDIYGGMPVFFDVRFTSAPTATHAGNRIVFDTINNSRGGGFDTSTGTFTAPIAGVYKFSYFMRGNILNQGIKIKPRINGSPTFNTTSDGTDQNLLGTAFAGNDGIQGSAVCIVSLEVGGTFELIACTHGGTVSSALASLYSGFTGEYISSL